GRADRIRADREGILRRKKKPVVDGHPVVEDGRPQGHLVVSDAEMECDDGERRTVEDGPVRIVGVTIHEPRRVHHHVSLASPAPPTPGPRPQPRPPPDPPAPSTATTTARARPGPLSPKPPATSPSARETPTRPALRLYARRVPPGSLDRLSFGAPGRSRTSD